MYALVRVKETNTIAPCKKVSDYVNTCYHNLLQEWVRFMNRRKKINQALKAKKKKMNSKLHKSNKPRYISKAEREKLATIDVQEEAQQSE